MAMISISRSEIDTIRVSYPTTTVAELLHHYNINQSSANNIQLKDISLDYLWHLIGTELRRLTMPQPLGTDQQSENARPQPVNKMVDQRATQSTPIGLTPTATSQPPKMRKQRGPGKSVVQSASRPHLQAHEHHTDLQMCINKTATELADPEIVDWLCAPHNGIHPDQLFGAAVLLLSLHATYPALVAKINAKLHAEGIINSDLTAESKTLNKRTEEALKHIFGPEKATYAQSQAEFRKARKDDALKAQFVQKLLSAATYGINPIAGCARCKVKVQSVSESENEGELEAEVKPLKRKLSDDDPATTPNESQAMPNFNKRAKSEHATTAAFLEIFIQQFVGPVIFEPIPSFEPGFGEGFDEVAGL